mgnify:CR=1 FL=1
MWGISVNGSDPDKQDKILPIVRRVLGDMVKEGIDKTLLEGALNRIEFSSAKPILPVSQGTDLRYPLHGFVLYDGDPLAPLAYEGALKVLRDGIETAIMNIFCRNTSWIIRIRLISLVPEQA